MDTNEFAPRADEDVTDELVAMLVDAIDSFQGADVTRVDWEAAFDRVDGYEMSDGRKLDLGCDPVPAWETLKRRVRAARKDN